MPPRDPNGPSGAVSEGAPWLGRLYELAGLNALALAQPVLALAVDTPDFFVLRDLTDSTVIAFGLCLVVGIPLLVLLAERAAEALREGAGHAVHTLAIGAYIALLVLLILRRTDASALLDGIEGAGWAFIVLAVAASAAVVRVMKRSPVAHSYLRVLGLSAPVVLVLFLFGRRSETRSAPPPCGPSVPFPSCWWSSTSCRPRRS